MNCHKSFFDPLQYLTEQSPNLVEQIYYEFPMGKPMIFCNNVPSSNPNFEHCFYAFYFFHPILILLITIQNVVSKDLHT